MARTLIAVDIGNSRIKFGRFDATSAPSYPHPSATLELATHDALWQPIESWLRNHSVPAAEWWISSVQQAACRNLTNAIQSQRPDDSVTVLSRAQLPLAVNVPAPEKVGLDRLAGAVAVNRLRSAGRSAVKISVGTALTVDFISADGTFQGGAIAPGIGMSAQAMHQHTDQLPLITMSELADPPPACGRDTVSAMRSGLYWGTVGAMRELIARLSAQEFAPPEIYLTGGAAPIVANLLGPDARCEPHLVLAGVAIAART